MSKLDESRWICRLGNESTIIHTDETREVVISRGEQLITLKPIGKAYMRNWSIGKKELFRRHQCKVRDIIPIHAQRQSSVLDAYKLLIT